MIDVFLELSKYIFAFLMAFYALSGFRGASIKTEEKRKKIYYQQYAIIFAIHFLGFFVMFIKYNDIKYFVLYLMQLIYFVVVIGLYYILYPRASRLLINNMCMLMAIGFIMIARLKFDKCVKQFLIALIGSVIMFIVPWLLKTVKSFRNFGLLYCLVGLGLLTAVLFGNKVFGANLTLSLGPITVQPAEFVKILYIMFIASMFNKSSDFKQTCIVIILAALHVIILVLSTDLGAALIFFVVYIAMLYIATRKITFAFTGLLSGAVASLAAYNLFSHIKRRVDTWINPWADIDGNGYQICQSLFAIGMGSWFGYGLCEGLPDKIPVAEKDFMFAAITEEFGLVFSLSILMVCLNNLILMMNIASRCKTLFYRLVAVGIGVTYGFQVFLTVGGAINFIPMTGVTLPFVSYGGSSILSSLICFALINGMYIMRHDEGEKKDGRTKQKKAKQ